MAEEKVKAKTKNGDGHDEAERSKLEKYEQDKIDRGEGMPPHYRVLFGQEGSALSEVARLTNTEKVLFAIQVMQEQLASPLRKKRASTIFREAYMHNSIGVDGEGRDDIKIMGQQQMEQEAAKRGQLMV